MKGFHVLYIEESPWGGNYKDVSKSIKLSFSFCWVGFSWPSHSWHWTSFSLAPNPAQPSGGLSLDPTGGRQGLPPETPGHTPRSPSTTGVSLFITHPSSHFQPQTISKVFLKKCREQGYVSGRVLPCHLLAGQPLRWTAG